MAEGFIRALLRDNEKMNNYLENYCVYIMPMNNKDGVARGVSRFNVMGMDLNRNRPNGKFRLPDLTLLCFEF